MRRSGFTLIELLLSIALIGIIAGISLPVYVSFQTRNELATTTSTVVDTLRRAQNYARTGMNDSQWGVSIQANSLVLFKGSTYASRDMTMDEVSTLPGSVVASGLGEVVFSKMLGAPTVTGSVVLASSTGDTKTMTVNNKGMVAY